MDTIVSNLPMAMGTDEQQSLHPFFRQEFGLSVKSTPSNDLPSTIAHMNDAASLSKQSSAPPHELQDFTERNVNAPQVATESSSGVDEDPNESRRKRRRTDKSQRAEPTATSNAGLSAWLGNGNPMPITTPAETCVDNEVNLPTFQPQPPLAQAQFSADATVLSTTMETEQPEEQTERSSARQKTLKLNPNGKFLSSPASSPPRDTKKRATGKRGRPPKVRSKLVIIKYTVGPEIKTGEHIDSILSGKLVHRPPVPVAKTTLPSRKPATIKSSKPTHPFFTKKPAQKTDDQIVADSKDEPRNASKLDHLPAGTIENKRRVVAGSMPSFSTFGRRVSKFPELLDPLWPPQGLVHIRDVCLPICATDTAWQTAKDRKKSKIAAISIRDEENVLLTGTAEARRITKQSENSQDAVTSLRHPVRHVASNQILRTAMEKQMSWSSPNPRFPWNASSPPLAKIGTSLLSSVSAFDCGKYETQLWTQKYAPKAAEEVLQLGREPQMLRDWLRHLTITAVDTGKPPKDTTKSKSKRDKKRKKRQKAEKLDGFIVSSEEEASEMDNLSGSDDELAGGVTTGQRTVVRSGDMATAEKIQMTNAILLSGPAGCGKTASVYAVAKELDFEVFEINPGSRRSARDMLERVGDMTQNHLVHLLNEYENPVESMKDDGKQNKLMGFFKGSSKPKQPATLPGLSPKPEADPKRPRQQKQSLILLEEADLLFEEDKQFWTGVLTLIAQSRRPIIITCNDESLIPTQDMSLHAILRYQKAPQDFSVDYLLLVAANEGHILKREAVTRLYQGSGMDLRKSLMDLNFWCQMGVGSEKAGLDWLLPAWPPESNVDFNGDRVRVLSLNTYERYMGWFNRDLLFSGDALEKEAEVNRNILHWWGLGLQESEDVGGRSEVGLLQPTQFQSSSKAVQLDMLCREADYYDMRSSLDILCSSCSIDMTNDGIDISAPPLPEGHRSNYLDTYPLLQSDLRIEHSSLSEAVSTTFDALLSQNFRPTTKTDLESSYASRIVGKIVRSGNPHNTTPPSTLSQFQRIFEPIMRPNYSMPSPTARPAPSFENGLAAITEDLAPYIRGIMVFDGRLYQYRQELYELTAQQNRGEKRSRTTRASRAALEGGDKSSTRKERWFSNDTPFYLVQATAGPSWQHVLYQMGYFHVQAMIEPTPESNEPIMSIDQIIENVE